jgi:hypothetical protein
MALNLKSISEHLLRRLSVNYIAYLSQDGLYPEWTEGYLQAKKDCEEFLKQLSVFDPDVES